MVNLDEWEVIPHHHHLNQQGTNSDLNIDHQSLNSSPNGNTTQTDAKNPDESVDLKMDSAETESKNTFSAQVEKEEEKGGYYDEREGNMKMWKWSLNGIGAVCSIGVAAATVCIIIFGNSQTRKPTHHKLQIQIYADTKNNNKRVKQVVEQQGNRINQAISALTGVGVPFTRAQITFGGHYDTL